MELKNSHKSQKNNDSDDEFMQNHEGIVEKSNMPKNVLILPLYS